MTDPRLLIVDTTGPVAVIEVYVDGVRSVDDRFAPARHAQGLVPGLKRALAAAELGWGDLDAIAVNVGPGSFTGIRVALATLKAIVYVTGTRLIAVDQFDAYAAGVPSDTPEFLVATEGQLNTLCAVRFGGGMERAEPIVVRRKEESDWAKIDVPVYGPLSRVTLPVGVVWRETEPRVAAVALDRWRRGHFDDPMVVEPCYVRPSSAEEKWDARAASG